MPDREFLHDSQPDALAYAKIWNVRVCSRAKVIQVLTVFEGHRQLPTEDLGE